MNFTSRLLKVHRAIVGRLGNVILGSDAEVAELADAPALGAGGRKAVGVRVPSSADLLITANVYVGFADVSRDREVGNSQVWSAKIAEGWKKCTAVNTVNKSDARILPRAGIAWLALLLAA